MRAYLRARYGLGPLGLLLATPMVLVALLLLRLALTHGLLALEPHQPTSTLVLTALLELAGAVAAVKCIRVLQDAVESAHETQ